MTFEFKTLVQLQNEGQIDAALGRLRSLINSAMDIKIPINDQSSDTLITQIVIGIIGIVIIGIICLPFGATISSIKNCQFDSSQKLLKSGGVLLILMTSLSGILFLELIKISTLLINT